MKVKVFMLIFVLVATGAVAGYAQEKPLNHKLALGFHLNQNQQDFGFGLQITTPYFANRKVAVRLRGSLMWNQHLNDESITVWSPYSNMSLGVVGIGGEVASFLRLYGEGGVVIMFPSSDFSTKSYQFGGYGLFGFEFFMDSNNSYFIEIGGIGTGAVADKVVGKPIYSNGMLINVGFRYQF